MILRFFFDYMRSRFQESISYELVAKDRLAIGDALDIFRKTAPERSLIPSLPG